MITLKDLRIINDAMAQYEALLEDTDESNLPRWIHVENYGDVDKTVDATRTRIWQEIHKREEKRKT